MHLTVKYGCLYVLDQKIDILSEKLQFLEGDDCSGEGDML